MKAIITFILVLFELAASGQIKIAPTDELQIVGLVRKEKKLAVSDLVKLKSIKIEDVVITNHLGVKKGTASGLSGIPVKEVFSDIQLAEDNPKLLSKYYLIFQATDGYQVVYSWNEIFNSSTGDNIFIIVEKDGKRINEMEDRILVLTRTDINTGRRFIKSLNKIVIQKVQ